MLELDFSGDRGRNRLNLDTVDFASYINDYFESATYENTSLWSEGDMDRENYTVKVKTQDFERNLRIKSEKRSE